MEAKHTFTFCTSVSPPEIKIAFAINIVTSSVLTKYVFLSDIQITVCSLSFYHVHTPTSGYMLSSDILLSKSHTTTHKFFSTLTLNSRTILCLVFENTVHSKVMYSL